MLTQTLHQFTESVYLRLSGGDAIKANELRARTTRRLLSTVLVLFLPLVLVVGWLALRVLQPADPQGERDVERAVGAYALHCADLYLKNPSDGASMATCFHGEIPSSALPAGGRALTVSSVRPSRATADVQTWSVIVDGEIPQTVSSSTTVPIRLGADVSIDSSGLMRMVMLPRIWPGRGEGQPVEVITDTEVAADRPLYKTAEGFLSALFVGQGKCQCEPGDPTPWAAAIADFKPAPKPLFATMAIRQIRANNETALAQAVPPKADGIEVTVRTVMQTPSGVQLPMDFPLLMSVVGGRWQVDAINDAPSVIAPSKSGLSTPTTAPSTTTTTAPSTTTTTQPKPTSTAPEGN